MKEVPFAQRITPLLTLFACLLLFIYICKQRSFDRSEKEKIVIFDEQEKKSSLFRYKTKREGYNFSCVE